MIRLGGRLLAFTLVAALALTGIFLLTEGPIEQRQMEAAQAAQRAVFPEADAFEAMPLPEGGGYPLVTGLYAAMSEGELIGYVLSAAPMGYGGPMPITMGVGADGAIHGIEVGELLETPNWGTVVAEEPFLSQYVALPADPDVIDREVDVIAGTTVSSAPFKEATRQMAALARDGLGVEPNPGVPKAQEVAVDEWNPYPLLGFGDILRIQRSAAGRETAGYAFELAPRGYQAPVVIRAAIDGPSGTVAMVELIAQNDSPGWGSRLEEAEGDAFFAQFAGNPLSAPLDGVDVISGVTVTCDAVKRGVAQAAAFYMQHLIPAADPYEGVVFEDVELAASNDYRGLRSAQRGMRGGAAVVYRFVVQVAGYAADYEEGDLIVIQVDVDANGDYMALVSVVNPETAGFGNRPFEEPFMGQFIGKPAMLETVGDVQTISGATVSSEAVRRGLRQAANAYQSIIADQE